MKFLSAAGNPRARYKAQNSVENLDEEQKKLRTDDPARY